MLQNAIQSVFAQLRNSLEQLTPEEYTKPCINLSGNTIGQHVRHIIELFQCLEAGYYSGIINYENRKRDIIIETNKDLSWAILEEIQNKLNKPNRQLELEASYEEFVPNLTRLQTNYLREIAYNLEHAIHHMALIRIGINEITDLQLPETFGVAGSTIKYRRSCAQ